MLRFLVVSAWCVAFWPSGAGAQTTPWSYSASAYFYIPPHDDHYLQPTLRADRERLHLEARYHYEGPETASLWAGYNFSWGDSVTVTFTPLLGVVFGEVGGIAPGGEVFVAWKQFELYSEGEYVHDLEDEADSFFYSWSELTLSFGPRWRAGAALQRTQMYETPREFQWGVSLGASIDRVQLTGYAFDLDLDDKTYVLGAVISF